MYIKNEIAPIIASHPSLVNHLIFAEGKVSLNANEEQVNYAERIWDSKKDLWRQTCLKIFDMHKFSHYRDMDALTPNYIFRFNYETVPTEGITEGLIISATTLFKLIGVYYYHEHQSAAVPMVTTGQKSTDYISYFPYNRAQIDVTLKILSEIQGNFPDYSLFNNAFGHFKIDTFNIHNYTSSSLDLFHTLFSDNIHGII